MNEHYKELDINNFKDEVNSSYYFSMFNVEISLALKELDIIITKVELKDNIFTFKAVDNNIILKYNKSNFKAKINFKYSEYLEGYNWEDMFCNDSIFDLSKETIKIKKP